MSLAAAFTAAVNAAYAACGESATYEATDAASASVTVVPEYEPSALGDIVQVPRAMPAFRIRTSEISQPKRGDTLTHDAVCYVVEDWDRINETEWRLIVRG